MTFDGFRTPTKNYFPMPNTWIDICAEINNLAELKVIQYVLRHTWGYKEYGIKKVITTDEFMYGRKRADGTRIDKGTGLSNRSVIDGLRAAEKHGYLESDLDETDKARKAKSYALKMQSDVKNVHSEDTNVDVKNVHSGYEESTHPAEVSSHLPEDTSHRTEKDTLEKHLEKDTLERQYDASASPAHTLSENVIDFKKSTNGKLRIVRLDTDTPSQLPIATAIGNDDEDEDTAERPAIQVKKGQASHATHSNRVIPVGSGSGRDVLPPALVDTCSQQPGDTTPGGLVDVLRADDSRPDADSGVDSSRRAALPAHPPGSTLDTDQDIFGQTPGAAPLPLAVIGAGIPIGDHGDARAQAPEPGSSATSPPPRPRGTLRATVDSTASQASGFVPPKRPRKLKPQPPPPFLLTEQQQAFWMLWCAVWFNKDIKPTMTETAHRHVVMLAPFITTQEQMDSLEEYTRKFLAAKGVTQRAVQLGNLVNCYSGWKQAQEQPPAQAPPPNYIDHERNMKKLEERKKAFIANGGTIGGILKYG